MIPELPVYAFAPNAGGLFSLLLTIVIPLAVAVVTTRITRSHVKAYLMLGISGVKTLVEALVSNANDYIHFGWVPFLMNLVINIGVAGLMYNHVWKPTGVAAEIQENVGVTTPR